jgi:hypothetical protein
MHTTDRLPNLRSRAFAAAGVATLGLSLLMAIAPAVAKSDNANSGTVKVHAVGQPADNGPDGANDPHVCQFWLGFYFPDNESGNWEIYPWSSGADASAALTGTYSTSGGFGSTDALWLTPDHYKLFWLGANDLNWKHKAFWVDEPCPDPTIVGSGGDPGDVVPGDDPADDPADLPGDDPGDETPGDVPGDVSPGDDPGDETPGDVNPGDDPGDETPGDVPGDEVPAVDEPRQGTQDSTSGGPAAGPAGSAPAAVAAPSASMGSRSTTLPDTSTGSDAMFVTAAGLLMLVVAHRLRRREGALILG